MITRLIPFLLMGFILLTTPAFSQAKNMDALPDPEQEKLARSIMKEIRCLQCQNQSIVDSDADLALDLRKLVRMKVAEGMSRDQVKQYLVDRYGDWILLEPPVKPATYFLWGAPLFLMGLLVLFIMTYKNRPKQPDSQQLSPDEETELQRILSETQSKLDAENQGERQ